MNQFDKTWPTKVIFIPKVAWYFRCLGWYSLENSIQPYVNKAVIWDGDGHVKVAKTVISSQNGKALDSPYKGQAFLLKLPEYYLSEAGQDKQDMTWVNE